MSTFRPAASLRTAVACRMRTCLILLAACGGGSSQPDAKLDKDAAIDAPADASPCGNDTFFTGELIDWDSTDSAFLGVNAARVSVQGMPAISTTTPPNGRLELCVPTVPLLRFDVDAPAGYLDGTAYVEREALGGGRAISLRSITTTRAASFYTERGLTFDPARAHVLVFLAGDRTTLTLDRPHDAAQNANDDAAAGTFIWADGAGGRYVLFPNVDVAQPTGVLTGDTSGPHTIAVTAGQLSLVAISFAFL